MPEPNSDSAESLYELVRYGKRAELARILTASFRVAGSGVFRSEAEVDEIGRFVDLAKTKYGEYKRTQDFSTASERALIEMTQAILTEFADKENHVRDK